MIPPVKYFKDNDLWDFERLKQHAEHHLVRLNTSSKYPNLVMLHYAEEASWDGKWNIFAQMCRGLIVDMKNQKIVAHPFNKFFNMDQVSETTYDKLQSKGSFETYEKLDGSMIIAFIDPNTDKLRFTTKGSFDSEHGEYVNNLNWSDEQLTALRTYAENGTLVFELIAKQFQIVIDYKRRGYNEGLYLIGYRNNISEKMASTLALNGIAEILGVGVFKTFAFESLDNLLENTKTLPMDQEGYVLRFSDDLLVKIKGAAYLRAHRFISHLSDKNILGAVIEGVDKEFVEICPDEFLPDVKSKIQYFKKRGREIIDFCYTRYNEAPKDTQKEYALWVQLNVEKPLWSLLFSLKKNQALNNKEVLTLVGILEKVSGVTKI